MFPQDVDANLKERYLNSINALYEKPHFKDPFDMCLQRFWSCCDLCLCNAAKRELAQQNDKQRNSQNDSAAVSRL